MTQATILNFQRIAVAWGDGYRSCAYLTNGCWYAYRYPEPVSWDFVRRWGVRMSEAEARRHFPGLSQLPYQSSDAASEAMARWFSPTGLGVPIIEISELEFSRGYPLPNLLEALGLAKSHGAARRLIQQGGVYLEEKKERSIDRAVYTEDFVDGQLLVRVGKNNCKRVRLHG